MHSTWPSVYLDLAGLSAERPCGSTTKTVGAPTDTRLAFHPTEISTYTWTSSILNVSSTKENDGLFGSWTVFWDTSTQQMNWADLAGCTRVSTGYAFPASAQVQTAYITDPHDALLTPPFGTNKCEPLLAIPTKVMNSRSEWTTCFPDATGANFDPPYSIILAESGFESTPEVVSTSVPMASEVEPSSNSAKPSSRPTSTVAPTSTSQRPDLGSILSIIANSLEATETSKSKPASSVESSSRESTSPSSSTRTRESTNSRTASSTSATAATTSSTGANTGSVTKFDEWKLSAMLGGLGFVVVLFL